MLARTAFCVLFSGLLKIDSALTLIRFPRRDPDEFFAIDIVPTVHVHYQQKSHRNRPNCVSSLFAIHDAVLNRYHVRIVEHANCGSRKVSVSFRSAASRLRFVKECLIDVEGLPHTYILPYLYGSLRQTAAINEIGACTNHKDTIRLEPLACGSACSSPGSACGFTMTHSLSQYYRHLVTEQFDQEKRVIYQRSMCPTVSPILDREQAGYRQLDCLAMVVPMTRTGASLVARRGYGSSAAL